MPVTIEPPSSTAPTQLDALLHHAALAPLDDTGWLRVTGSDRVRWLNGMVTNSIADLKPGQGCYNFFLSAQGRIQGDAYVFADTDALLVQTARTQLPTLLTLLDRFIIMDDVELTEFTDAIADCAGLSLTGPHAAATLDAIGLSPANLQPLYKQATTWHDTFVVILYAYSPLVPRFQLWADPATLARLAQTLTHAGATPADTVALETLRILEGTPRYGTDIRNSDTARDLPQETSQTRALHFAKGCYLGQEIVERIRSRGQVHRTFIGFRLQGELPPPGTPLQADGKPIGELTSTATVTLRSGTANLALGYLRREALDRNATLTYPGGQAVPSMLPFSVLELTRASTLSERP